jgi:TolB-like protein/Flp pilus assembly protein TadD
VNPVILAALALTVQCPAGTPPPCHIAAAAPRQGSIAVLYFAARDSGDAYLADGLTEDITTLLARTGGLVVKPSSSVRLAQRRQPGAPANALGRSLNVRYVVQGSLRRTGEQVRLNVEIVDAGADRSVWGETYDRSAQALLDLPGELADEVTRRVSGIVGRTASPVPSSSATPGSRPAAARPPVAPARTVWQTRNPEALDHFRRGNYLLATRVREAEAFDEYQQAARLDPAFASAIARSAYALALLWNRAALEAGGGTDTLSMRERGLMLAYQALRLDSTNSDAWMALGYLRALNDMHTLAGAEEAFVKSVRYDSTNAEAWHQYAQIQAFLGDDSASVRSLERALALEPARAISLADLSFNVYSGLHDVPRAYALIDSSLAINPQFVFGHALRGFLLVLLGRAADALHDADAVAALDPQTVLTRTLRAVALARLGDSAGARQEAREWLRPHADGGIWGAWAVMALGDTAWALEHLERMPPAVRNAATWTFLRQPTFDGLRDNPRFRRVYLEARPVGARAP